MGGCKIITQQFLVNKEETKGSKMVRLFSYYFPSNTLFQMGLEAVLLFAIIFLGGFLIIIVMLAPKHSPPFLSAF